MDFDDMFNFNEATKPVQPNNEIDILVNKEQDPFENQQESFDQNNNWDQAADSWGATTNDQWDQNQNNETQVYDQNEHQVVQQQQNQAVEFDPFAQEVIAQQTVAEPDVQKEVKDEEWGNEWVEPVQQEAVSVPLPVENVFEEPKQVQQQPIIEFQPQLEDFDEFIAKSTPNLPPLVLTSSQQAYIPIVSQIAEIQQPQDINVTAQSYVSSSQIQQQKQSIQDVSQIGITTQQQVSQLQEITAQPIASESVQSCLINNDSIPLPSMYHANNEQFNVIVQQLKQEQEAHRQLQRDIEIVNFFQPSQPATKEVQLLLNNFQIYVENNNIYELKQQNSIYLKQLSEHEKQNQNKPQSQEHYYQTQISLLQKELLQKDEQQFQIHQNNIVELRKKNEQITKLLKQIDQQQRGIIDFQK
ncbi:hypothetical protein SS50377_25891 [Spironucleus salmonicida]|uniref:Uncharacterized protein n=1 Tax=Spironucleus salmonicida TaxID=348837 RepID=V6LUF2_9EUKA|nr:hypothetical protein SS50377_25891 [Spironucleus salmonicida]|eukprot:EST47336.1 Hypothetical protein SS50377_12608 [Spironucleus salmonicida]